MDNSHCSVGEAVNGELIDGCMREERASCGGIFGGPFGVEIWSKDLGWGVVEPLLVNEGSSLGKESILVTVRGIRGDWAEGKSIVSVEFLFLGLGCFAFVGGFCGSLLGF